jgi:hypothetical protein
MGAIAAKQQELLIHVWLAMLQLIIVHAYLALH